MSTTNLHLAQLGYDRIDAKILALNLDLGTPRYSLIVHAGGEGDGPGNMAPRLETIYLAVRPILAIVAELPLVPPHWRDALRLFIATLDGLAAAGGLSGENGLDPRPGNAGANFKAGKDL